MFFRVLSILFFFFSLGVSAQDKTPAQSCNGSTELCRLRYNEVVYAATHNAQSHLKNWLLSFLLTSNINNQSKDLPQQLEVGIRAMKMPVHERQGEPYVCHGMAAWIKHSIENRVCRHLSFLESGCDEFTEAIDPCFLDPSTRRLSDALLPLETFLSHHSDSVLTLFLEDSTNNFSSLMQAFDQAHLTQYLYFQNPESPWPTLGTLVRTHKRLVVFINRDQDRQGRKLNSYHAFNFTQTYAWSTAYHFGSVDELKNDTPSVSDLKWAKEVKRSKSGNNQILILQHFVTPALAGSPSAANSVNSADFLRDRVTKYSHTLGIRPNFIWVDFFELPQAKSGVLDVVHELNSQNLQKGRFPASQ